jgi:hypothetical protein
MSLYLINTTVYSFSVVTVAHMDEDRFKISFGFNMSFVRDCVRQRDVELHQDGIALRRQLAQKNCSEHWLINPPGW